jgi:hypothetical protein
MKVLFDAIKPMAIFLSFLSTERKGNWKPHRSEFCYLPSKTAEFHSPKNKAERTMIFTQVSAT